MMRKYRAQAFIAGSSCSTCGREPCASDSLKHLFVVIYCWNYRQHPRYQGKKP